MNDDRIINERWTISLEKLLSYLTKTVLYEKNKRVSRPARAENCLIVFHTEAFKAYIVLKTLSSNFIVAWDSPILKDTCTETTGNGSSLIFGQSQVKF